MPDERKFYLAKNKLEYPNFEDAENYGGGAVAIRREIPASLQWEKIGTPVSPVVTPAAEVAPVEESTEEEVVVDVEPVSDEREKVIAAAREAGIKNPKVYKTETLKEKLGL